MLGRKRSEPALFQMVDLEALVPPDHRLRKIDRVLDLSFVGETVAECYSAGRGRPSVDPEPDITPAPEAGDPPGGLPVQEPQPAGAWSGHGVKYSNQTHRSTSDPEARLYRKGNAREAKLSYLVHDLLDTKSRVVLRRRASLAHSSAEREVALEMVDDFREAAPALGLPPRRPEHPADTAA